MIRFTHAAALPQRRRPLAGVLTLALMGLQALTAPPAWAELFTVNYAADLDDAFPGNGNCEAPFDGFCTLRAAINEADRHTRPDEINFNLPSGTIIDLVGELIIGESLTITGPGAARLTVRRTPELTTLYRLFNITASGTVTISGLTLTRGAAPFNTNGGAIRNGNGGTVNITGCTLFRNYAGNGPGQAGGGAIDNASSSGKLNIKNSTFKENWVQNDPTYPAVDGFGGAILNRGTLTVTESTFERNDSRAYGGAIYNDNTATITRSLFRDNGAQSKGGAIYSRSILNISNSTFYGNNAYGIRSSRGRDGLGGAIANEQGILNLTNSTVTANIAGDSGGGLFASCRFSECTVKGTLIAQNYAPGQLTSPDVVDDSRNIVSAGFNLIGKGDSISGFSELTDRKGTIASPLNPGLDPKGLRNNGGRTQTVALTATSPAVDRGTSASLLGPLTTDQRGAGFLRKVDKAMANAAGGDGTDIGAYELQ
jgi:CSLREA domain-containing protein